MQNRFDTIIFDLDGTLLNTLDDLADSINAALRHCGYPTHTTAEVRRFIGNGAEMLVRRALAPVEDEQAVKTVHASFNEIYGKNMKNKTAPYGGINAVLALFKQNGIKMAVVSNKPHFAVVPLIADYFGQYIGTAIGADENTPEKPDPTGTLKALAALGSERSRTVYMGDSNVDIFTAKNAGLFALGCSWGFRDRDELLQSGADMVIDSPAELPRLFGLEL